MDVQRRRLRRAMAVAMVGVFAVTACSDGQDDTAATTAAGAADTTTVGSVAPASTTTPDATNAPTLTSSDTLPAYAATLEQAIPEVMTANAIPGVVVLIRSEDGGDWSATFGTAELGQDVPMSLESPLRIGSNTKTMTSTVILQLVQEGELALDDPISKFRPDVPNGDAITIQQLAEMRSGLFSYTFDAKFNETLDEDPQKAWTPDELLAIAFTHPPNGEPGVAFDYSNTNIVLLGVVIEQLTGMTASEAFQERIFEPLGLEHTSLPEPTDSLIPAPHARGYQFGTNVDTVESYAVPEADLPAALDGMLAPIDFTDANPSWAWTAGGAISTPDDLADYVEAMVGGGLLDEATQKIRLDSIQPLGPTAPPSVGYGIGLAQFAPNIYGHDGQLPGYSTFMVHDPVAKNTIIIGCNLSASPVDGNNAAAVLARPVIAALYGDSAVPATAATTTTG